MLKQVKADLDSYGALSGDLPPIVNLVTRSIPDPRVPETMKTIIAISEIISFASQFRRNMWHWDGFELPINASSFLIAGSGMGKDSSVKAARRSFSAAYEIIEVRRKEFAKTQAIQAASNAGEDSPHEFDCYKKFYDDPAPVLMAPTTPQGLIQHLNDISIHSYGAGTIYSGEIGDELATNANMLEIIKTIAETYDTGDKEVVYTKGKEHRSKEIKALSLNSLLMGSPNYLLYDAPTRQKFLIAFGSKLARRTFFGYIPHALPKIEYTGPNAVKDMIADKKKFRLEASNVKEKISAGACQLAEFHLAKKNELLQIDEEVFELFETYKRYNEELGEQINSKHPLSRLVREHLQWKALKLAGAFAILNMHNTVQLDDYIFAIRYCEMIDGDMTAFETELVKEPYELFADYMKTLSPPDGEAEMSLHDLKKLGYVSGVINNAKLKDLVFMASSYDKDAVYTYDEHTVFYKEVKKVTNFNLSFIPVDNSPIFKVIEAGGSHDELQKAKSIVAKTANGTLQTGEVAFKDLAGMLEKDFAYSPFTYKDNKRSKNSIITGTKFLVLDVDTSEITATEAHYILQDINHHVALSSDASNEFKFRVIIELDSIVDESAAVWQHFYKSVSESLALNVDPLPQSQLFFSYGGRKVLSIVDRDPLEVRDHLMIAHDKANAKPIVDKVITNPQKLAMLADELTTFAYCFECPLDGGGSRSMIKMAYHARKLGMNITEIIELIHRANSYWDYPMDQEILQNTLINQVYQGGHNDNKIDDIDYELVPVPPTPAFKLLDIIQFHIGEDSEKQVVTAISQDRYHLDFSNSYVQFLDQEQYNKIGKAALIKDYTL